MTIISSMDENSSPWRKFLNLLKKLTKQFSLIKRQKYVFFNMAKLQIWFLTSICCNTFLNLLYCQAYFSDTSNECNSNLSSEQGCDSTKFQTFTRPDLSFTVQQVCQFMSIPTDTHLIAAKRILRYLNGTLQFGIFIQPGPIALSTFSDSNWARDPFDRRSTTGYMVCLGYNPIT